MAYTLTNGSAANVSHVRGSVSLTTAVSRRGQLTFTSIVKGTFSGGAFTSVGNLPLDVGEPVFFADGATTIFGGTVERIEETDLTTGASTHRAARYTCVDFDQLAERRIVAESYESKTLAYIVTDLITNYLGAEGVTAGTIETGPVFAKVVFNYRTAASCLDSLAELTGFSWWIDPTKALQFRDRAAITAPWSITDSYQPYRNIRILRSRYQYRNAQYVRAGVDLMAAAAEVLVGDGTRRTFNVSLPVGSVPTIEVNTGGGYASKTVGVNGVDSGKAFYYNIGRTEVTQASTETVLSSAHTVRVTYQGQLPIIVLAEDDVEQAARLAAEGVGSGKYESVVDAPDIDDDELALDKALALLRRYGQVPVEVTFDTDVTGLRAGQLMGIASTDHDLSGSWLIEAVQVTSRPDNELRYTVKALSGEAVGGWQEWFRRLRASQRTYVVRENETLILLRTSAESVTVADVPSTATSTSSGFDVGTSSIVGLVDVG